MKAFSTPKQLLSVLLVDVGQIGSGGSKVGVYSTARDMARGSRREGGPYFSTVSSRTLGSVNTKVVTLGVNARVTRPRIDYTHLIAFNAARSQASGGGFGVERKARDMASITGLNIVDRRYMV